MNFFVSCSKRAWQSGPRNAYLAKKSVEFLGHLIGGHCITMNEENLEKIRQAKRPTAKKDERSFLGLANYYRDHIPSFAAIAAPLSDLREKDYRRVRCAEPER